MSDASKPFAFSQFVPGFDFLRNLASGGAAATASAVPGMPSLSSWVAPTLSVEEVEKRIQELKTVQFWLEQNGHALKATIQALEVQKMTLSTLRGMNVQMEDLASVFTRQAAATPAFSTEPPAPAAAAAATSKAEPQADEEVESKETGAPAGPSGAAGVVDPLQWWGALTQQFQQIASSALHEASQVKMPMMPPLTEGPGAKTPTASGKTPRKTATAASRKKSAGGRSAAGSSTSPTPARKRARGH